MTTTTTRNVINETTTAGACLVRYNDGGGMTEARHSTVAAALRYIDRVLAVRHAGPFRVVDARR